MFFWIRKQEKEKKSQEKQLQLELPIFQLPNQEENKKNKELEERVVILEIL